jgi:histidinol-phosphate aminotransferase
MAQTRRNFVRTVGIGAAGALTTFIGARGRENALWSAIEPSLHAVEPGMIVISSNENPMGPGKTVIDAIQSAFGADGGRPGRYSPSSRNLIDALAATHRVKPANIVLGCGSTQILRTVTHVFTAKDKPLVATIPTYEECADYANLMGHPIVGVALDREFRPDLDKFAAAAKGAGLVFYCNPSNPSSTFVGAKATRDFLAKVASQSPDTTILVDEAYFDYVTEPDHETFVPLAVEDPRVLVARDFPPFEKTHCRIAFGTMDEMKKAVAVFGEVLGKKAVAA